MFNMPNVRLIVLLLTAAGLSDLVHCASLTGNGTANKSLWSSRMVNTLNLRDTNIVERAVLPVLPVRQDAGAKYVENSRKLASVFPIFLPQSCNSGLDTADCSTTLSSLVNVSAGAEIVIECGKCVSVDYTSGEAVNISLGINVIGKLYFPSTANLVLRTQYLFIQGELVIDPPQNQVKILLFGTNNQTLIPHGDNVGLCGSNGCDMARKPIVVAGGKVDIRGLEDPSCPSWVKLKNVSNFDRNIFDPCNELILENGDAETGSAQPFSSAASSFQVLQEGNGNHYFAVRNRAGWWNGISGSLPVGCFKANVPYVVGFRYRLNSTIADHAIIRFEYISVATGKYVQTPYFQCLETADYGSDWVYCNVIVHSVIDIQDVSALTFGIWLANNTNSDLDFDDLSIKPGGFDVLHVDEAASSCWKPGDEILLTSWLKDANNRLTATIESTSDGILILNETLAITTLATAAADPRFAIEVARLTRKVIFEGELDDPTREFLLGGHFIVYQTPQQIQLLEGVKLVNFGQQGEKGRYPIHFHLSGSVAGSIVSKNVIYNSNQRCVVVHGSHDLEVIDNVAFETHGHCFITEDGIETGNVFTRNLGASIRKPTYVIEGENDNSPSIFWITNPQNTFVDNIAAGSEFSGFWFDTRVNVRGPSQAGNEDLHPQMLSLGTFANNTAHSCFTFGIQYYSPGYRPLEEATMEGNNVYRNLQAGHFVHSSINIRIVGGIAAYNSINIQTFRNADIVLENITIIGYPDVDLDIEDEYDLPKCQGNRIGVSIHSWKLEVNASSKLGVTSVDLNFSGMGRDIGCSEQKAFWMDPDQSQNAVSDAVNRASGLTFHDDVHRVDFCDALAANLTNMIIEDEDGSFGPSGSPGFFVSDQAATVFAGGNGCYPVPDSCAYWCDLACLRLVGFAVSDSFKTGDIEMVVSKDGISATTSWDHFAYVDTPTQNYLLSFDGRYGIALPAGYFNISFVDKATKLPTWPSYVKIAFEVGPRCPSTGTYVSLVRPEATESRCGNLVKGGTFEENSFDYWQNSYDVTIGIVSPGSQGSGYALQLQNSGLNYMQMGQWIDSTCLVSNIEYAFEADVRLVDDSGNLLSCDTAVANNCPAATLQLQDYNIETRESHVFFSSLIGNVTSEQDGNGWYKLTGKIIFSPGNLELANSVQLTFHLLRDVNFQIDNVLFAAPHGSIPANASGISNTTLAVMAPTVPPSITGTPNPNSLSGVPTNLYSSPAPLHFSTGSPSRHANGQSGMPTNLYISPAPVHFSTSSPPTSAPLLLSQNNSFESSSSVSSTRKISRVPMLSIIALGIALMIH